MAVFNSYVSLPEGNRGSPISGTPMGFLTHLGSQDFSKSSALKAQGRVAPSNFSTKTSAPDRPILTVIPEGFCL